MGYNSDEQPPIPESYWVQRGMFAAGEYPGSPHPSDAAERLKMLVGAGIDHFIDLTEDRDGLVAYDDAAGGGRLGPRAQRATRPSPDHRHVCP